ncbi:ubiquitin-activating E1 FCCH domain-containing protein [uncultured Paraglaciecola sp.]|uniref:ubiquitin-activating E1 FCCH domain-containing protein n=1 Tax=uncultured Paraglaciecola sp. TaxID=1765024 RepID=UPI002627AFEA|nr:ubiquitin-activating E1 FCCH domain-containing protein [uncultured Paraglaciecola sp.]
MRKLLAPVLMASTMLSSANSSAETYYFSFSEGNDSNDGLSEASPFKTSGKLFDIMNDMTAGDIALLKRGDVWEPSTRENISGPCGGCTLDAYGTGDDPHLYSGENHGVFMYLDNSDGWTLKNFEITCYRGSAEYTWAMFFYLGTEDVYVDNVTYNNCTHGVHIAGEKFDFDDANNVDRITIKNSTFNYISIVGILGGGGNDYTIHNNVFNYNGWNGYSYHAIYWYYWNRGRITDNKFYHSNNGGEAKAITSISKASTAVVTVPSHGYTTGDYVYIESSRDMWELNDRRYQITVLDANTFELDGVNSTSFNTFVTGNAKKDSGACNSSIIVGHGIGREIYFGNNHIYEEPDKAVVACWGLAWDAGYPPSYGEEEFTDMTVENNRLYNLGNVYFGMTNSQSIEYNFNTLYHDNSNSHFQGFHDHTNPADAGLISNDVLLQYNNITVVDDSGAAIATSAGMEFPNTNDVVAKGNHTLFGDSSGIACTVSKAGELTQINNICLEGSSLTPSTLNTVE